MNFFIFFVGGSKLFFDNKYSMNLTCEAGRASFQTSYTPVTKASLKFIFFGSQQKITWWNDTCIAFKLCTLKLLVLKPLVLKLLVFKLLVFKLSFLKLYILKILMPQFLAILVFKTGIKNSNILLLKVSNWFI